MFWKLGVIVSISITVAVGAVFINSKSDLFELSVVHVNDFHARFDQVSTSSGECKNVSACIGGYARLYSQIRSLLDAKPDSVLLNGGDNFQGTLYYTLGKWNITQEFLNKLPWDATVLGNHEFDDKIAGVVPFMEALKTPIIVSNMDDSQEPRIQGKYTKSVVIKRNNKKIGIIGVIYSKTDEIASTENLKFYPESASVNEEAERLVKEEGVFTNIVLSHSGYEVEKAIAANATGKIGLVVGAHSHTFLWTGESPPGPDTPGGPYPTIVQNPKNKTVLVVQASCYSKYLGNISVFYNSEGEVDSFSGKPIFLDNFMPQDKQIITDLQPWKNTVEEYGSKVIGSTLVTLSKAGCYVRECNAGNFYADAMVFAYTDEANAEQWTSSSIAVINAGGIRTDIDAGNITYGDLVTAQPFGNVVQVGEIEGKHIKEMFEHGTLGYNHQRGNSDLSLLQVSGFQIVYNLTRPSGNRVQSIKVRCQKCLIPVYENLNEKKVYRIIAQNFLMDGGDGFTALSQNVKNVVIGDTDTEVYQKYLQAKSPIIEEVEGRITVISDVELKSRNVS